MPSPVVMRSTVAGKPTTFLSMETIAGLTSQRSPMRPDNRGFQLRPICATLTLAGGGGRLAHAYGT